VNAVRAGVIFHAIFVDNCILHIYLGGVGSFSWLSLFWWLSLQESRLHLLFTPYGSTVYYRRDETRAAFALLRMSVPSKDAPRRRHGSLVGKRNTTLPTWRHSCIPSPRVLLLLILCLEVAETLAFYPNIMIVSSFRRTLDRNGRSATRRGRQFWGARGADRHHPRFLGGGRTTPDNLFVGWSGCSSYRSSSTLLWQSWSDEEVAEEAEQDMDHADDEPNWSERIHRLLPQSSLNLSSPTQVSRAIFGNVQSASRAALQDVVEGQVPGVTDVQRQLAMLVLDHRQWQARRRRRPSRDVPETSQSHLLSDVVESAEEEEHTAASVSFPVENESDGMAETPQQLVTDDWLASDESTELSIMDPYQQRVEALLGEKSKIDPYWKDSLLQLSRPSARSLVSQLNPDCPLGYDPLAVPLDPLSRKSSSLPPTTTTAGKKGSFLAYCRDQKERHPDCVILCRCGEFLVLHCCRTVLSPHLTLLL
jgi:hypothetical protein